MRSLSAFKYLLYNNIEIITIIMMEIKRICVYCASSTQISHSYFEAAYELGQRMARLGIGLVNGAGNMGLMQASADGCMQEGRL